jgi:hypothetical protein
LVSPKYHKRFKVEGFVNYQLKSVDFDKMSPENIQGDSIVSQKILFLPGGR